MIITLSVIAFTQCPFASRDCRTTPTERLLFLFPLYMQLELLFTPRNAQAENLEILELIFGWYMEVPGARRYWETEPKAPKPV